MAWENQILFYHVTINFYFLKINRMQWLLWHWCKIYLNASQCTSCPCVCVSLCVCSPPCFLQSRQRENVGQSASSLWRQRRHFSEGDYSETETETRQLRVTYTLCFLVPKIKVWSRFQLMRCRWKSQKGIFNWLCWKQLIAIQISLIKVIIKRLYVKTSILYN